jgi:hypothetical protein
MRAVSLSDAHVNELLTDQFVCAWVNIADDPAAGSSHPHSCTDQARELARGLGEHNTQTLILTPDGRLLSALAGYIGPSDLAEELHFGLALWEVVRQAPPDEQAQAVKQAHTDRAKVFAQRKEGSGPVGAEEQFFGGMWTVGNKRGVADHQFSAAHPLLAADRFSTGLMVGNAQSWFVATNSDTTSPTSPSLPSGRLPGSRIPGKK